MVEEKDLLNIIEKKRNELIHTGLLYGLNSSYALKQSQELDDLLNEYEQAQKRNQSENTPS
ncbi:aspartyl-phosphate phosphatase Spo0E family protein [Bacillus sp. FJAT-45350]|uniref:aspartyl-phosphate phosphatase Spo0E family protein n=1 Tax=Bacillus sp. FJAT-45350 TaxID=2011014 RepID=UPI000BB6DF52|nr:aspartyl-phosphate phosphatase Spo0E family protein [Bacillus sp. FJAT-45350]